MYPAQTAGKASDCRKRVRWMKHNCIKCGALLVVGENITQYQVDHFNYNCRRCYSKHILEWNHRTGRKLPMCKNKKCSAFLGVHVAEHVLSHVFNNVEWMPYGNPGFDFVCGSGYWIDAKSSCRRHHEKCSDDWMFNIKRNQIADYFLCLAFDNRESLEPEHVWLIPGRIINDRVGVGISISTLEKWAEYELPIDRVVACCDVLKGGELEHDYQ